MRAAAKLSVTVVTSTAISDKNMANSTNTSTTERHGKLLVLLVPVNVHISGAHDFL